MEVSQQTDMQLPYELAVLLLGIFLKENNALCIYVYSRTVHHSKKKEPGRLPLTGEKIKTSLSSQ